MKIIRERLDPYRTRLTDPAVLAAVGEPSGLRVLDAGCGEGYMSRLLAAAGADVIGIDTSASLIAAARDHADQERHPVTFVVAGMENLPEDDETFDVVVCNHVLSDVDDPEAAIAEVARVLKPDGRLVVMMLHPCFYTAHAERDASGNVPVTAYFGERRVDQRFLVAGIESPDEVHMTFRPLEFYAQTVVGAGLVITGISEPHPDLHALTDDPWWRANFVKPLFLLLSAEKRRPPR